MSNTAILLNLLDMFKRMPLPLGEALFFALPCFVVVAKGLVEQKKTYSKKKTVAARQLVGQFSLAKVGQFWLAPRNHDIVITSEADMPYRFS